MKADSSIENVKTELSIEEHIDLHRKGFVIQKAGLIFIILMVAMAAIGAFGDGVLSKKTLSAAGTTVEYQRFYRFEAKMPIRLKATAQQGRATVSFDNQYLKDLKIESINPEPAGSRMESNSVHFFFEGAGEMDITFYMIPQQVGSLRSTLAVNDHSFDLRHFIYP